MWLTCKVLPGWVRIISFNFYFGKKREFDIVQGFDVVFNLLIGLRFLVAKLVTRKRQDVETIFKLWVLAEVHEVAVSPVGVAAVTGYIYNKRWL